MSLPIYVKNSVVKGFGRGKELGCPTANVDGSCHLDLSAGVYCGLAQLVIKNENEVQIEQNKDVMELPFVSPIIGMVCSFGNNPHYGNKENSLEVHILENFEFNFYGAELRVLVCKKMREQEKYSSLDELIKAIANDIRNATSEVPNFTQYTTNSDYFILETDSSLW